MRSTNKRSKTVNPTISAPSLIHSKTSPKNVPSQPQSRSNNTLKFTKINFFNSRGVNKPYKYEQSSPYKSSKKREALPQINSNQKSNIKSNIVLIKNSNSISLNKNGFRTSSDIKHKKYYLNNISHNETHNHFYPRNSQIKSTSNAKETVNILRSNKKNPTTTQIISREKERGMHGYTMFSPIHKNGRILYKNRSSVDMLSNTRKMMLNDDERDQHKKIKKVFDKEYGIDEETQPIKKSAALSQRGLRDVGIMKQNQDSYVLIENIFDLETFSIFAVFDGHGSNGHLVSQFIKRKAEEYFTDPSTYSKKQQNTLTCEKILEKLQYNNYAIITRFNKIVHNELESEKFDINFSGSTCVIVFHILSTLIVSNCGDSRAIVVIDEIKNKNKIVPQNSNIITSNYNTVQLSVDHKPELPLEKERIEHNGGVVAQFEEDNGELDGPMRVWVKGEDYPGIATSRSIGDVVAKKIGVIYVPEIEIYEINTSVKYIVVASDGVWEFLSNNDVMDIINPFFVIGDVEGACKEVVKKSTEKWEEEESGRDDITVVVSFIGKPNCKMDI
jgi:serine/threonine protein phosphatase PrpC